MPAVWSFIAETSLDPLKQGLLRRRTHDDDRMFRASVWRVMLIGLTVFWVVLGVGVYLLISE